MPKININGTTREMTKEEIAELQGQQEVYSDSESAVAELREQVAMLTECLLEMSEMVYV